MSRRGRMRWTGVVNERPTISDLGLNPGQKARLFRILFQHGLCNGTALFLTYDQGLEHGPQDFFANPAAADPAYVTKLAVEAGFNGIVCPRLRRLDGRRRSPGRKGPAVTRSRRHRAGQAPHL